MLKRANDENDEGKKAFVHFIKFMRNKMSDVVCVTDSEKNTHISNVQNVDLKHDMLNIINSWNAKCDTLMSSMQTLQEDIYIRIANIEGAVSNKDQGIRNILKNVETLEVSPGKKIQLLNTVIHLLASTIEKDAESLQLLDETNATKFRELHSVIAQLREQIATTSDEQRLSLLHSTISQLQADFATSTDWRQEVMSAIEQLRTQVQAQEDKMIATEVGVTTTGGELEGLRGLVTKDIEDLQNRVREIESQKGGIDGQLDYLLWRDDPNIHKTMDRVENEMEQVPTHMLPSTYVYEDADVRFLWSKSPADTVSRGKIYNATVYGIDPLRIPPSFKDQFVKVYSRDRAGIDVPVRRQQDAAGMVAMRGRKRTSADAGLLDLRREENAINSGRNIAYFYREATKKE